MQALSVVVPDRSLQQRFDALDKANSIRTHRAIVKKKLKARELDPVVAMRDPLLDTMKVFDLLVALPKFGRVKANKMLTHVRMSPSKTVGGMSVRQRSQLTVELGPYRVASVRARRAA